MKFLSQGVKVGVLVILLLGGSYTVWKAFGKQPSGAASINMSSLFRDASGLPVGSRVMIAGLPVGEIARLSIEGRYARVSFRIRQDVSIWSNAVVYKKSSSLLGAYYLEIDPGSATSLNSNGALIDNVRLGDGDTIERVVEATTPDEVMRRIEESLPNVDKVLLSVRDLSEDMRNVINGPVAATFERIDGIVEREADTLGRILERADRSMERIEAITVDIRNATGGADDRLARILDQLDQASAEARDLMVNARQEVKDTGDKVREKLDMVDDILGSSSSVASKLSGDEGTLGRLLNDSTIADNVEDLTENAKGFVQTLTGMQTYVGLRTEYNVTSAMARHYVTMELATRPDKFYYLELEKGPRGNYPIVTLEYDPTINPDAYVRKVRIEDKIRFTFQIAKRIGWATFRFGIKESTGGVGFDINTSWLGRNLRINTDLFDATFDQLPRLKVSAAYEVFRHLYILGGIDEVLNTPQELTIDLGSPNIEEPVQFSRFHFGRDVFLGAMLRFNDRDLAALLTVGGSAVAGALD